MVQYLDQSGVSASALCAMAERAFSDTFAHLYGLELLATVYWVVKQGGARTLQNIVRCAKTPANCVKLRAVAVRLAIFALANAKPIEQQLPGGNARQRQRGRLGKTY
jgi:hypothetical protein